MIPSPARNAILALFLGTVLPGCCCDWFVNDFLRKIFSANREARAKEEQFAQPLRKDCRAEVVKIDEVSRAGSGGPSFVVEVKITNASGHALLEYELGLRLYDAAGEFAGVVPATSSAQTVTAPYLQKIDVFDRHLAGSRTVARAEVDFYARTFAQ